MTRGAFTFAPVRISFVLRLDPEFLAHGQLVGEIEEVGFGRRTGVQGAQDIIDFCCVVCGSSDGFPALQRFSESSRPPRDEQE